MAYKAPEYHPAFEEYCEAIFELNEDDVDVIQARIAERLTVSRPAVSEMMRRLETEGLSDMLVDNDGQHQALVRVEAIWAVARPEVASDHPELLEGFDTVIDLVRRSVERRRPADADKAHKNLLTLIAAYQR